MEDNVAWLIAIGVFVVRVVLPVIKWLQEKSDRMKGGLDEAQMAELKARIEAMARGGEAPPPKTEPSAIEAAIVRTDALKRQAEVQLSRLPAGENAFAVVREALEDPTLKDLARIRSRLTNARTMLAQADGAAAEAFLRNDDVVEASRRALGLAEARLALLGEAAVARRGPLSEVMADADVFGAALTEPLRQFARGHAIPLPPNEPISMPAAPGEEAMIRGLFDRHPVIFVPQDFGEHIYRWPAVAHEVGHVLWHAVPTLRREVRRLHPYADPPYVAQVANERISFDLNAAFGNWLEEITCDVLAIILLGPAGFRGMMHALASDKDTTRDLFAWPDPSRRLLDEHPPAHLRVHLGARLLHELGFDIESKELLAQWQKSHEDADYLILPTMDGRSVAVNLESFVDLGASIIDGIIAEDFRGLDGYPLSAVVGQEMSPGVWARVKRRADQILAGESFHDNSIVAIAAGIEAAALRPNAKATIEKAVRATIVGRGQHLSDDTNYRGHPRGEHHALTHGKTQIRDALILWEVLHRKHGGSRPGRRGPDEHRKI